MNPKAIFWVPFAVAVFVILGLFLRPIVRPTERVIHSQLVGRPVPEFALPPALAGRPGLSSAAFRESGPRLVNIFASWCIPCRAEAAQLDALARRGIPIDGIAVRDRPEDLAAFLAAYGDRSRRRRRR